MLQTVHSLRMMHMLLKTTPRVGDILNGVLSLAAVLHTKGIFSYGGEGGGERGILPE